MNGTIYRIDPITGNIVWAKQYMNPSGQYSFFQGISVHSGNLFVCGYPGFFGSGQLLIRLDNNGTVISSKKLNQIGGLNMVSTISKSMAYSGYVNTPNGFDSYVLINNSIFDNLCSSEQFQLNVNDFPQIDYQTSINLSNKIVSYNGTLTSSEEKCLSSEFALCSAIPDTSWNVKLVAVTIVPFITGLDSVICTSNSNIDLSNVGIPIGGTFYLNSVIANEIDPTKLDESMSHQLVYVLNDSTSCEKSDTFYFRIKLKAPSTIIARDICLNTYDSIYIEGNPDQKDLYFWDFDGGQIVQGSGSGPYLVKWTNPGDKKITLNIQSRECGNSQFIKRIKVNHLQVSTLSDSSIISGEYIDLLSTIDPPNATVLYKWSPSSDLSCADCKNPRATPTRTTKYILMVTDLETGCTATTSINVRINCCK
ncbi:MAG: hypothetical protein M3Q56_09180 [Bacteroidota bacterium]|nr:hypothetical protein [Bacteroidota bacterium]